MDAYSRVMKSAFDEAEATADRSAPLMNRDLHHARVVLDEMISRATTSLEIVTGKLNSAAYDYRHILRVATARPELRIRILVEAGDGISADGKIDARRLRGSALPDLLRRGLASLEVRVTAEPPAHHFTIRDDKSLRFELEHDTAKAVVLPYQPERARELRAKFETYWSGARPVRLAGPA